MGLVGAGERWPVWGWMQSSRLRETEMLRVVVLDELAPEGLALSPPEGLREAPEAGR